MYRAGRCRQVGRKGGTSLEVISWLVQGGVGAGLSAMLLQCSTFDQKEVIRNVLPFLVSFRSNARWDQPLQPSQRSGESTHVTGFATRDPRKER